MSRKPASSTAASCQSCTVLRCGGAMVWPRATGPGRPRAEKHPVGLAGVAMEEHPHEAVVQLTRDRHCSCDELARVRFTLLGLRMRVSGLEALDGTPVVDVKPVL